MSFIQFVIAMLTTGLDMYTTNVEDEGMPHCYRINQRTQEIEVQTINSGGPEPRDELSEAALAGLYSMMVKNCEYAGYFVVQPGKDGKTVMGEDPQPEPTDRERAVSAMKEAGYSEAYIQHQLELYDAGIRDHRICDAISSNMSC